jgi:D-amino-acid oxidase
VNCTGLGARELCGDPLVHSGRGVVLTVENPGITRHVVSLDGPLTYVLTRTHDVVLGGTDDDSTDLDVSPALAQEIHSRCLALEPRLPARYETAVGFRPLRKTVRLEREPGTRILHNYGHGGAGFTVSWGCANAVLRLCAQIAIAGR